MERCGRGSAGQGSRSSDLERDAESWSGWGTLSARDGAGKTGRGGGCLLAGEGPRERGAVQGDSGGGLGMDRGSQDGGAVQGIRMGVLERVGVPKREIWRE